LKRGQQILVLALPLRDFGAGEGWVGAQRVGDRGGLEHVRHLHLDGGVLPVAEVEHIAGEAGRYERQRLVGRRGPEVGDRGHRAPGDAAVGQDQGGRVAGRQSVRLREVLAHDDGIAAEPGPAGDHAFADVVDRVERPQVAAYHLQGHRLSLPAIDSRESAHGDHRRDTVVPGKRVPHGRREVHGVALGRSDDRHLRAGPDRLVDQVLLQTRDERSQEHLYTDPDGDPGGDKPRLHRVPTQEAGGDPQTQHDRRLTRPPRRRGARRRHPAERRGPQARPRSSLLGRGRTRARRPRRSPPAAAT